MQLNISLYSSDKMINIVHQVLEVHRLPIAVLPPSDHSKLVMLSSLFVMLRPCVFLNINASSR